MTDIKRFITTERGDFAGQSIFFPENREILFPKHRDGSHFIP
jgi:hypothetical protein